MTTFGGCSNFIQRLTAASAELSDDAEGKKKLINVLLKEKDSVK